MFDSDILRKVSLFMALLVPFSVLVSSMYLHGYWTEFHVPVFSLISAHEMLVVSAVPFLGASIFAVIGGLTGSVIADMDKAVSSASRWKKFVSKTSFRILDSIAIFLMVGYLVYGGYGKWLVLPILFSVAFIFLLVKSKFVMTIAEKYRGAVLFALFSIVFFSLQAFGYGKIRAGKIIEGQEYRYIKAEVSSQALIHNEQKELRFVGVIGDERFFCDGECQSLVFFSNEQLIGVNWFFKREQHKNDIPQSP